MSKSLEDALGQGAWSVSAVMFDLNAMHDDEGRPIAERRADASARVGVEMEMQLCPFEGVRNGKWMNVSALSQITAYYKDALAELAAFRRCPQNDEANWDDMLACVVDLYAGPAMYLLQQRSRGPVPAKMAVTHKLAAGMFGLVRDVHERLVLGSQIPMTVDAFMDLIEETGALLGATKEACAGSLPMIRKVAVAFLEGSDDKSVEIDPVRLDIARNLALQVKLGIFWQLYDRVHAWNLVRGEFSEKLEPCNQFLKQKIERAANEMGVKPPQRPDAQQLPDTLDASARKQLLDALNDATRPQALEKDMRAVADMLNEPGSVIAYHGPNVPFILSVANYLNTYRLIKAELTRIELELREQLGYAVDMPIRLGNAIMPMPQALPWYELIVGRKMGEDGHLSGSSTRARTNAVSK